MLTAGQVALMNGPASPLCTEANELLCRIGPGTPMGEAVRRYWVPALLSTELPEPDCPPVEVKLLGEDLVGFRATSGRVGIVQWWCPHRGTPLWMGRNEEEGLRCLYHGWKFDVDGNCVDQMNEPQEAQYKDKIQMVAYPAVEMGGIIWFSIIAYVIVRTNFRLRLGLDFLSWLPWALPGIILGLGFLWMVLGIPILRPLHSTTFVLILIVTLGSITVGTQMFKANLLQLGQDMEEVSRISGGSWFYTYRRVLLPLMMPTVISVGLVTFVFAARDVSRVALLASSQNRPLALLQLDYLTSYQLEAASVVGVIIILLTTGVAVAARLLGLRIGIQTGA